MLTAAIAALGWCVLVFVPGLLMCTALRAPAGAVRNMSLAPVVGIGLTMAVAQTLQVADARIRAVVRGRPC